MISHQHKFEIQDTTQTLEMGLAEYLSANSELKRDSDLLSAEARQFFRSHDAVHVVYGCGTSMPEEAIVKLASLFGTTGGKRILRGYAHRETFVIYRKLPLANTLLAFVLAPYLIVRTLWHCLHQTRRWPWVGYEKFMSTPLAQIRAVFGIKVAHG